MPLDINELQTPDQERQILDMEKKRKYVESADSNNGSGQPVVPISSNVGLNPHDFSPYQTDQQGNIDYGASALRAIPEASVGYLGLKGIQGLGEGLKRTLSGENRGIKVQERQLKLQEKEGIKPTVTSEAGIDPKLALEMRLKEEKHIAEERRAEEIHKAKLESMGAKTTAPIESVSPALQGSTVELPNTSTSKIETPPTATGESVLNMLPKGDASAPQSSISVAPNAQGAPAIATPPTTPAQQVIEQTTGIESKPSVPSALPLGETIPNPVASGDKANPLHEPGSDVGKTQLQASAESTENKPSELKKEIIGSKKPRGDKELILKDTPEQWTKLSKEGQTFLPGYGAGDNNLYNTYGAEGRKAILEKYNNGKPIGSYKNYEELNQKLKAGVPIGDVPDLMNKLPAEEEAGNYGKLGRKGLVKATGVGGLLVTAAQLSHAAEQAKKGNYAPARESLFDLVSALGGVGGMAATHMGGLNKDEEKQLAQHRYAYEMSKKNGAGRGQLNPSQ